MKSKELIRQLQELDPTGEIEVTGWYGAIHFANRTQYYWDGYVHTLILDEHGCAKGMRIGPIANEDKIVLHEMDLEDVLLDNPDAPITINVSGSSRERYEKKVAEARQKMRQIIEDTIQWKHDIDSFYEPN